MPEARLQRTRRTYACPVCDGDGRVFDYDGTYDCDECDGSGVVLELKPRKTVTPDPKWAMVTDVMTREALALLTGKLTLLRHLNKWDAR